LGPMNGLRTMLVIAVFLILGVPPAPEHVTLQYSLTFSGTSAGGTIVGTWGGTAIQGMYSDGRWAVASGGRVVVGGTYRCSTGCDFAGTVIYRGTSTAVSLGAKTLGETERTETVAGNLSIDLTPPVLLAPSTGPAPSH
jgi:hypothetical protein